MPDNEPPPAARSRCVDIHPCQSQNCRTRQASRRTSNQAESNGTQKPAGMELEAEPAVVTVVEAMEVHQPPGCRFAKRLL